MSVIKTVLQRKLVTSHISGGQWTIGDIDESCGGEEGEMRSVKKNERVWPSEVKDWKYFNDKEEWMIDPQLTVTGNTVFLQ